jgi:hypothetical protein
VTVPHNARQATLDEALSSARPRTIDERFRAFDRANPHVYPTLVRLAREMMAAGHRRVGIGHLWEVMRWELHTKTARAEGDFKLNDHYRSRYARRIVEEHPDLAPMFELRRLRAA